MKIILALSMFLIVLAQLDLVKSECCTHNGKFGCCGFGKCNLFCCNCDRVNGYVCKPSDKCDFSTEVLFGILGVGAAAVGKRTTDINTFNKFLSIDNNFDGKISIKETLEWFKQTYNQKFLSNEALEMITLKFKSIDINNNNFIESNEFDFSL